MTRFDASAPQLDKESAYLEYYSPNFGLFELGGPGDILAPFIDDEGRPVRENKASPDVRAASSYEFKTCPFAGSRLNHPLPMNASAMRQIGTHWKDILDATALLRQLHLKSVGKDHVTALDMLQIANIGTVSPVFLLFRRERPYRTRTLPAMIAGLFKVLLDLRAIATGMLKAEGPRVATTGEIFNFAERNDYFIGTRGVCAGPPKMISELIGAVVDGLGDPADPLSPIFGDLASLHTYANEMMIMLFANSGAWNWLQDIPRRFVEARPPEAVPAGLVKALEHRPQWTLPDPPESPAVREAVMLGVRGLLTHVGGEFGVWVANQIVPFGNGRAPATGIASVRREYIAAEEAVARAFTRIQSRLLAARGYGPPPPLDIYDVRRVFGGVVPAALEGAAATAG